MHGTHVLHGEHKMSYQQEYEFMISMRTKSVPELHSVLMNLFDLAEKVLGTIQFTEGKSFRETYEELENNVLYLLDHIWHLQHILRIREQNESKRMVYEENAGRMMPGHAFLEEFSGTINRYYDNRMSYLKDITQIKDQGGDVDKAEEIARAKLEEEEKNKRQLLNHSLLRYVLDIVVMRARIERMNNSASIDMY